MNQKGVAEVAAGDAAGKRQVNPRTDFNPGGALPCHAARLRGAVLTDEKKFPPRPKGRGAGGGCRGCLAGIGNIALILEVPPEKGGCQGVPMHFSVRLPRLGHVYAW